MASVPASTSAASSSTSAEASAADHTLEELEAMVEELEKMLPNLSESTEMLLLNWWLGAVRGLMEVGSLLEAQRQRMQVMLDRYDYFRPGGGGR